jgi:putative ABC transport system permease protein
MLAKLSEKLQKNNLEIVPWYALAGFYNKTASLFTKQIQGIRLIIALIILLSISNTMTMSVMERIGEIGTSMALGVKRAGIMRLFLCEGVLLGCLGGLLGLILGLLLAGLISSIGIPMPPPPGMARGYTGQILVTLDIALESLALAVGTTLAASVFPAWRASQMRIVDALRRNR